MLKSTHAIGLDITPTTLSAVALKRRGKVYSIAKTAIGRLEHGIVVDGEVMDAQRLGAAIAELWHANGLGEKKVNLAVANQRCITRIVELPKIKKKSVLRDALGFQVQDNLPIPIEDAVWDYHTIGEFDAPEGDGNKVQRHIIVMVYRESVERYRDAIEQAGLVLNNIDLAAFAVMRAGLAGGAAFAELQAEGGDDAVAMCDIGPTSTNVIIARNGVCEFNRIVSFGTHIFSQTMVDQFGWSFDDADRVKSEAGVLPLGGVESPGDPYTESRRIMQYVADQFAQEIRTSFDYYHHTSSSASRISRIVLSGEGALLRGLEERFASELAMRVSILDASPRLDTASAQQLGPSHAHLAVALGLGMEEAA